MSRCTLAFCRQEQDISSTEIYPADEISCTRTMGDLASVNKFDGRIIGAGPPGPVTRRLSKLQAARTAKEGVLALGPQPMIAVGLK